MYDKRAKQDALDLWFSMPGEMSVDDFAAELDGRLLDRPSKGLPGGRQDRLRYDRQPQEAVGAGGVGRCPSNCPHPPRRCLIADPEWLILADNNLTWGFENAS